MVKKKVSEIVDDKLYSVEAGSNISIVSRSEKVYTMFGIDTLKLTEEHIKALRRGKCLWFTDGEYAHILYMEKVGEENDRTGKTD